MTTLALRRIETPARRAQATPREDRYNRIVEAYADDLYRYARWLSRDPDVADDLVQETFLRAWKSIHRLESEDAAKSWLLTILRRENARRFERKQPLYSDVPTESLPAARPTYDTSTEAFVLRQALERLPADYREPLLMQVIQGFSQKEIAAHLGISVAGAGTRLFRARQQLRQLVSGD
jgi:RNA polymerase sigma-70 factor (ECF subfamily)